MRDLRDISARPLLRWARALALVSALAVVVCIPDSVAAASGTATTPTGDALYQPVPFGKLPSFATSGVAYDFPIVGMASTPDGGGYWLVASDGGVFSFGDATFHGSTGGTALNKPIVGMAPTPDGGGYWLVASDGGVFSFGDATFHGSTGGTVLNKPVVGMAPTPDGGGYWLVASDGGVFSFGDATFHGSTGGTVLNKPVVGMAATSAGYWLVAADGGVFTFGGVPFWGSMGGRSLDAPIVGIAGAPMGDGYWLVGADGGVFTFGHAAYDGSLGGQPIAYPIGAIATSPGGGGYWLLPVTDLPIATLGTWTGIEPSLMQFSGDAGNIVSDIAWSSWTARTAVGRGEWGHDNCVPDCAQGVVTDYPTTITLAGASGGRFTQLTEAQSGPFGATFVFALPGPTFRANS